MPHFGDEYIMSKEELSLDMIDKMLVQLEMVDYMYSIPIYKTNGMELVIEQACESKEIKIPTRRVEWE